MVVYGPRATLVAMPVRLGAVGGASLFEVLVFDTARGGVTYSPTVWSHGIPLRLPFRVFGHTPRHGILLPAHDAA